MQMGGQDQWGNLVTGTELIRKKYDAETYAMTWPLITDASGKKFGKSEGNALFLDPIKTTPYFIYQYFMNTDDNDLARYLKMLTLLETEDIDTQIAEHMKTPENRVGQKLLAYKVVEIIHGWEQADIAVEISEFMFGDNNKLALLASLESEKITIFQNAMGWIKAMDENLFGLIVRSGLAKSNSEARNSVSSGAIMINGSKITDTKYDFSSDFLQNNALLLQKGKKNLRIITK